MIQVRIKRVFDPEEASDGFRVLVDRLWPRGIRKEQLLYDAWAKDITPSTPLRQWFHQDETGHWAEFVQKYRQELSENPAVKEFIDRLRFAFMILSISTMILLNKSIDLIISSRCSVKNRYRSLIDSYSFIAPTFTSPSSLILSTMLLLSLTAGVITKSW